MRMIFYDAKIDKNKPKKLQNIFKNIENEYKIYKFIKS